jgi:Xaa-Pro aminopeptidase
LEDIFMHLSSQAAQRHRQRLIEKLLPGDLLILPAASLTSRNSDVSHRFRQNSDFYYLTAFPEPGAYALIRRQEKAAVYTLFVPPKCPEREVWDGFRVGVSGAVEHFAADDAYSLDEIDAKMPDLIDGAQRLIYPLGHDQLEAKVRTWRRSLLAKARLGATCPSVVVDSGSIVHELRLIKDEHELELMERAAQISVAAHCKGMTAGVPGFSEHQLEGLIEGEFRAGGAARFAYPSIVASGSNGCVLHYHENDSTIADGDMLLIDAGGEYAGYASDITVTWPANGHFSEPQRRLYESVLRVQLAVVDAVRPGATFKQLNTLACRLLLGEMQGLGLVDAEKSIDELFEAKAYMPYYMHSIGHWIGMDVHDVGAYGKDRSRPFEPGMVLTVEPGLYIAPDASEAPAEFRGLAVRIEDDLAVTTGAARNLSHGLPRSVAEIEAFMARTRA